MFQEKKVIERCGQTMQIVKFNDDYYVAGLGNGSDVDVNEELGGIVCWFFGRLLAEGCQEIVYEYLLVGRVGKWGR